MEQRQLDIKNKIANYKNSSEKYYKLSKSINKHKELLSSKKNLLSKKGIDKKDHSKKTRIDLARLSGKDKPLSQKVKFLDKKLEEAKQQMENVYFHERYVSNFVFQGERAKCNFLFKFDNSYIEVYENINIKSPELIIKPEDKIAITGSNGVGKSLLIKYIYKTIKIEPSKILYIPQEFDSEEINNIKSQIQMLNRTDLGKLYTIIFRLGSEPDRLLNFETPSPGEIRKIMFGIGILKQPVIIIMDEPTNHLDLPSIEKLEETLRDFVGALLLISHDLTFIKKLTTIEWNITKSNNMSELTII
jgi:ATPase subunit of ABC transporter with duplicated ATPase domains